jgi:hypothetical protein
VFQTIVNVSLQQVVGLRVAEERGCWHVEYDAFALLDRRYNLFVRFLRLRRHARPIAFLEPACVTATPYDGEAGASFRVWDTAPRRRLVRPRMLAVLPPAPLLAIEDGEIHVDVGGDVASESSEGFGSEAARDDADEEDLLLLEDSDGDRDDGDVGGLDPDEGGDVGVGGDVVPPPDDGDGLAGDHPGDDGGGVGGFDHMDVDDAVIQMKMADIGVIIYYDDVVTGKKFFEAKCTNRAAHGRCVKTKTAKASAAVAAQGRPLGFLVCWLEQNHQPNKPLHLVHKPSRDDRRAARHAARALFPEMARLERKERPINVDALEDSEPENCP